MKAKNQTAELFSLEPAPMPPRKRSRLRHPDGPDLTPDAPGAIPMKTRQELIVGLMLPPPPSANVYWRTMVIRRKSPTPQQMRRGEIGRYTALTMPSREAKAYIEDIKQRIKAKGLNFHSRAPIRLDLVVCPGSNGRADISNRVKVMEDALQAAGVFEDDCQVCDLRVERGPVVKGGRVIVSVTEVKPDPNGAMVRSGWNGT